MFSSYASIEDTNRYVHIPEYMTFEIRFTEWEHKMLNSAEEGPVKKAWEVALLEKRREASRIWRKNYVKQ